MEQNNIKKFHEAVNALAEKWCGISDAFSMEQTADMLTKQTAKGENEDVVTARMCAAAYGMENVTVRDAALITDDELRRGVQAGTAQLVGKGGKKPTMADLLDLIARHWKDLDDKEKLIVADVVVGELNNDAGTAA